MIHGVRPLPPRDARGRFTRALPPPPPPPPPGLPITAVVALAFVLLAGAVAVRAGWVPQPGGAPV
ncbi:MAG: chemotaxis response regulator protein-glutamate methylesterase, partial [Acidimicrobiia bacterium]